MMLSCTHLNLALQVWTYLWSCSCGAMLCLFKADNPNRVRERERWWGGCWGRARKSEKWEPIRGSGCRHTLFVTPCGGEWGGGRDGERGGHCQIEREREREREIKERDRGGETRMRDSGSAARASALPAFATCVYSTFPESRLSSLCVSHGSDLGEWSGTEQQWKATDLCVRLHCGQVSSLCISLWVQFSLFSPVTCFFISVVCEEKWTTSAEFLSCSILLLLSLRTPPLIGSIL